MAMCDYLEWADLHNVPLTINYSSNDLKQCGELESAYLQYLALVDDNLQLLATSELITYVHN
jgi:hypothetical protein